MAAPKMDENKLRAFVELVEDQLRSGVERYPRTGNGAVKMAALEAVRKGFFANPDSGFTWLERAEIRLGLEPDWDLYQQPRFQQPVAKFHLIPAAEPDHRKLEPTGEVRRHLFIPDEHNDPRHPHRLQVQTWVARYGSEHRHHSVIKAGDSGTFDSVSRHDKDDTYRGRFKPGIKDDLSNHLASLQAFERGRDPTWKPRKKKARGNHEQRLWDYENNNPASAGTHTLAYEEQLLQFGWQERPFGEIFYVDQIGYTHCPMNGMGRPMGGKTATHRASAMLTAPLVYGHTHKFQIFTDPKMGEVDRIMVVEGGCALP
ncbi:MAG: hypothetical protein C0488_17145, partial [Arthrobacter sp.]|nr:hypothetical protein [Arthrobacter sp.]